MLVLAILLLLISTALLEPFLLSSIVTVGRGAIWWHLSTGLWILQHHAVPHHGLFSQASSNPWISPSWGYDVLLAVAYRLLDLRALPILYMGFKALLALVTFLLAGGLRGRLWKAILLSVWVQCTLISIPAGSTNCSILLFAVELLLLAECRRTHSVRPLYWLPPLFLLWANLDLQFIYGVLVLLLALVAALIGHFGRNYGAEWLDEERLSALRKPLALMSAACVACTLITPYFYHPYGLFVKSVTSAANPYMPDLMAMNFRSVPHYLVLLLTMTAFLTFGRMRSRPVFPVLLLAVSAALTFHSQRDIWVVALAAAAMIGEAVPAVASPREARDTRPRFRAIRTAALLAVVVLGVAAFWLPKGRDAMLARASTTYPVAACDYIREHDLPQPIFNPAEWGGFLTYYLPEYPVAIDSRTDLYGDEAMIQYSGVISVLAPPSSFPPFRQAATLLLRKDSVMGKAFLNSASFKVAYTDAVSVVLLRNTP